MNDHRILASGNVAVLDESARVTMILSKEDWYQYESYLDEQARSCSICDGLGHGYPGGRPCPLEDVSYADEPWWAL
jgi:hypothetical protein